jgi:hypothetical protein
MQTLTTYNGITLGFDEISRNSNSEGLTHHLKVKGLDKHKIIGTTSTLTNEQVEPFVEKAKYSNSLFIDYTSDRKAHYEATKSFGSLLEVNNIDPSKEYVILKLLNNE